MIRDKYLVVWGTYARKEFYGSKLVDNNFIKLVDEMKDAYETVLLGEIQKLKTELKADFRMKLGIIEDDVVLYPDKK